MMTTALKLSAALVFILLPGTELTEIMDVEPDLQTNEQSRWMLKLTSNIAGYLVIIIPLLLARFCFKRYGKISPFTRSFPPLPLCLSICFEADINEDIAKPKPQALPLPISVTRSAKPGFKRCCLSVQSWFGLEKDVKQRTYRQNCALLALCILGLQLSYVMWGLMQERIMTRSYDGEMFKDSQFLVFCNRFMTILMVIPVHFLFPEVTVNPLKAGIRAPFFEFSFSSISNILSSWCQYEALKHITFPTQVLSKACKIIPVMIMGRFIQHRTYTAVDYLTSVLVSSGLSLFLLSDPTGQEKMSQERKIEAFSGTFLVICYLALDSLTSNLQDRMFKAYLLSPLQVMVGTNFWSVVLTLFPLLQQNGLFPSLRFAVDHTEFAMNVLISATCSAVGQLFIFLTIAHFGPAVFVLIMTLRMGLSILLSCVLFSHPISAAGIVGILIVFCALFVRVYWRSFSRTKNTTDGIQSNK
ncbi:unnamed protein product [Calicophoron daubneyi]|uniref:Adenosine 3'-phospho 5'-phosphosulfate transporter 1 n=1 Tax=Calicophoron daubneyi TaxID=300641 RepID=A0AAV2T3H6_CALDB